MLGELDARQRPRAGAARPRSSCARGWRSSSVDLKRGRHLLEIDRDVEQVIYVHTTAQQTGDGLAAGRDAHAPAVHAQRARPRAGPPPRAPADQARLPAAVRDQPRRRAARPRPRLRPLRPGARVRAAARRDGRPRTRRPVRGLDLPGAPRARPEPRPRARSAEAVDYCAETIESAADCKVDRGEFRQRELWTSTLPLGRDVARRTPQVRHPQRRRHASRWSAPAAAPRPGSRSRSPTPAARSSAWTPTTPSTPTTRC